MKKFGHHANHGEPFNAIFAMNNHDHLKPLVVFIHDGPHEQFTGCFDPRIATYLEMDFAVLMINYRGSTGLGDSSLESIISNIGLVKR